MLRQVEYAAPASLVEACGLLFGVDGAIALAGGTDVVVSMNHGKTSPALLVDLKRLGDLDAVTETHGGVEIGGLVSMTKLARSAIVRRWFPALVQAAGSIGCWQVRNLATVGGNLCNASPSADTTPPLLVYGASVLVSDGTGTRELPIGEFLVGPGMTALARGEVLTALRIPKPPADLLAAYVRRSIRRSMDIPLVNVAVGLRLAGGVVAEARIALGAVAPVPFRAADAELALVGRVPDAAAFREAATAAAAAARPITDVRASAEYRSAMVEVFVRRALASTVGVPA